MENFEKLVEDAEKEADALNDEGHKRLITDLELLLSEAKNGCFHDFHRNGNATPKSSLIDRFKVFIDKVKLGLYDN